MPWPLYPWGKKLVSFVQEARCVPGPIWTGAEHLSPTGFRSLNRAAIATCQTSPPNRVRMGIFGEMYKGINQFNPLNAELNPICHLLALLGAHHILHVSRIRVKKGHQPRINIVKFEKGDLLANSHNISTGGRITSLSY